MTPLLPPNLRWWKSSDPSTPAALAAEPLPGRICAWPWIVVGLSLVAGLVLFYRLGSFRTFSSHEVYAAVPAREMIESQNWVFPTFGGLPRLRKPPLVYWLVGGSATLFGKLSPLTARLPSALAGLLLAGLMGLWAKRWYGPRVGWAAVFVQLTAVWFVIFARKAEVDMVLCLLTTTALFLVADQSRSEQAGRAFLRWLAVYVLLSLAWLAKFHYGPAMVLAPVVVYFAFEKRWSQLKNFAHPIGLMCFLSAIVIWPILVLDYAPNAWEVWQRETVGRAIGEMGSRSLLFYVPFLIWLPLPWTPFAVASISQSWRAASKDGDSKERFLWIWFFTQFAIVTMSANKHLHYLLALLPVTTLLAARSLSDTLHGFREGRLQIPRLGMRLLMGVSLVLSVLLVFALRRNWPDLTVPAVVLGITLSGCVGLGCWLLSRRRVFAMTAVQIFGLMIFGVVLADWVMPRCDRRVNVEAFAKDIRRTVPPNEPVCVFRMDRDPLVYHVGSPVFRVERLADLKPKLEQQGCLHVVGYERLIRELRPIATAEPLARLPKGSRNMEPVEGDLVLVKLSPRKKSQPPLCGTPIRPRN